METIEKRNLEKNELERKKPEKDEPEKKQLGKEEIQEVIRHLKNKADALQPAEKKRLKRYEKKLEEIEEVEKQREELRIRDEHFMKEALKEAKKALKLREVPIGCVIVCNGVIIARGYNRRNTDHSTLSHAEITAIKKASKKLEDWRLEDCSMYVTLEPCQMCAGAIVQARMKRVVMGAMNQKAGCCGSILNMLQMQQFNHRVESERGVLEEECSALLQDFFRSLRIKK